MADVSGLIAEMGINFLSAASFFHDDFCILVFRVQTDDISPIVAELKKRDYQIIGPEQFEDQWQ